jgi:hypothetical protein
MWGSAIKETALGLPSGSRLKRRNFVLILFPENVGVKENRGILLCKTSGGDTDTRCGHDAIRLYDPYNNRECLHCHLGARSFEEGPCILPTLLSLAALRR